VNLPDHNEVKGKKRADGENKKYNLGQLRKLRLGRLLLFDEVGWQRLI
jgi:hypothetical protein